MAKGKKKKKKTQQQVVALTSVFMSRALGLVFPVPTVEEDGLPDQPPLAASPAIGPPLARAHSLCLPRASREWGEAGVD